MLSEILEHLDAYLGGISSHEDFESWFLPATWHLKEQEDPAGYALKGQIALALAEFDDGHLDEQELHDRLQAVPFELGIRKPRSTIAG